MLRKKSSLSFQLFLAAALIGALYVWGGPKAEAKEPEATIGVKEVTGELMSLSPMRNPKFIGIACGEGEDGYDIHFKLSTDVQILHKKSLNDIQLGDWVGVIYEERTEVAEDGREKTECIATTIRFVRAATRNLKRGLKVRPEPEDSSELDALSSF